jgi:glycine betaine/proline transport system permease protein
MGVLVMVGFTVIGLIGVWKAAMTTLSLIITAVTFCIIIGLPLGIACAKSDRVQLVVRPILDVMQTLPAFVYLVPIVMLMGIGNVPGVMVTIVFALPPILRLTNLGLREVPASLIEAAYSFGSSPRQVLLKIQMPLALRPIMAGVNQTLMMALAMTVISSMIAVDGLGMIVLRGIGRLDMGLAAIGGIGIVILAMILDRVTQEVGLASESTTSWSRRGPIGLLVKLWLSLNANRNVHSSTREVK